MEGPDLDLAAIQRSSHSERQEAAFSQPPPQSLRSPFATTASESPTMSTAFKLPLELPSLDSTLGAMLLGMFIGLIIYGVTLNQAYQYFRRYPQDSLILKTLVLVVLSATPSDRLSHLYSL
ncbi:hypothetical protein C8Q70DRAFT_401916 [Cubamyces menziesii]|nr:hypothetical protein C8Q70DRAFT_401916 [Cubamyces menziesii]